MQIDTNATPVPDNAAPPVEVDQTKVDAPASAPPADDQTDATNTTAPEGDEGSKQQDEQPRDDKGQYKSGIQKRIDDLTFRRNQAEREAAHWKQQALARADAAPVPRPGDFDSDADYEQAMLDHRIESGINRGLAKTAEQQSQKFSQEASTAAGEAYNQRVAETVSRIPDFVDVVSKSDIAISPALQEALRDSEKGPDLVYHLAKNPAEAERLNAMSVRQMDREIGRLELTIGAAPKPAPPAARITSAPPPVKPGSPASAPANTDPSRMSQPEFESWMRANKSKYV